MAIFYIKPLTLKRAAKIYRDRTYILFTSAGRNIDPHIGRIVGQHPSGLEIDINVLRDIKTDAEELEGLLAGKKDGKKVPGLIAQYLMSRVNNTLVPLKEPINFIVTGSLYGGKSLFKWPEKLVFVTRLSEKNPGRQKTLLSDQLEYIGQTYSDYQALVETRGQDHDEAFLASLLEKTFHLLHGPLLPETLDEVLNVNQEEKLHRLIPIYVNRVFRSLVHGAYVTWGLAMGTAAWFELEIPQMGAPNGNSSITPIPVIPISRQAIHRFAQIPIRFLGN